MSGHSKWSTIKHKKGIADKKRASLFTKLSNAITVAAREGGGSIETNFKLRLAVDKAKSANMPKDNIERAIKRGTGELNGARIEEKVFEAFGPHGVALVIETLTDNNNRTTANLKHILSKHGGSLSGQNSTAWMFERKGVIRIEQQENMSKDEIEMKAIDAGAEDISQEDDVIVVFTKPNDLQSVKEKLDSQNIHIAYAENELVAKEKINITDQTQKEQLEKLFDALDEAEDVNEYYSNAELK